MNTVNTRQLSCKFAQVLLIALSCPLAWSQEVTTKSAEVPAPQRIVAQIAAMRQAPPNAEQYADRKQGQIGEHHRPTIELVEPAGLRALELAAPQPAPSLVADDARAAPNIQLLFQHALNDNETNNITSTVCEPSVAARGHEVLLTGNWFAAFSTNGGSNFTYINPDATFPSSAGGFCCDQVAIYDPRHDVMIWFLQYITTAQGNIGRIAVAHGDDIANQNWHYYDFSPQSVGGWTNEWFDYPDLALSDQFLYVTSNVFSTITNQFTRAVVLRLPLDALANYQGFSYRYFDTNQVASIRPAQGGTSTMYLGAHRNLNSIRVFTWPEASNSLSQVDVQVQPWSNATRVAPGPDGNDWLGRADGRITAAAEIGGNIAFGWTAAQDAAFRFPHVRVALIDKNTKAVSAQPHVWNSQFAFAYPAFASNASGRLGVSMHYGGGTQLFPSHAVGVLDDASASLAWNLMSTAQGTDGPSTNRWGDYLAVRPHGQQPSSWVATGFTLQGGSDRTDVEVKYVHFQTEGAHEEDGDVDHPERERLREQLRQLRDDLQRVLDSLDALEQDVRLNHQRVGSAFRQVRFTRSAENRSSETSAACCN